MNYSTDNQTRRGTTHDSNLLKFMGLVENEAKQDRANHTAQDDSQSYSATIFLFALGKSKRLYIFGTNNHDQGCYCAVSYRKVLENDLIQQGRHGVKHSHVDAVSEQEQNVIPIGDNPFDGLVVGQRGGRRLLGRQVASRARWQTWLGLEN